MEVRRLLKPPAVHEDRASVRLDGQEWLSYTARVLLVTDCAIVTGNCHKNTVTWYFCWSNCVARQDQWSSNLLPGSSKWQHITGLDDPLREALSLYTGRLSTWLVMTTRICSVAGLDALSLRKLEPFQNVEQDLRPELSHVIK